MPADSVQSLKSLNPTSHRSWLETAGRWFAGACGVWIAVASVILILRVVGVKENLRLTTAAYLAATVFVSLGTIAVYWWDKRRAMKNGRRISEKTLHVLAALGGWPGAAIAIQLFRHKTQKTLFRLIYLGIALLHIAYISTFLV